jgi:uncharacterized membrane protein YgcG
VKKFYLGFAVLFILIAGLSTAHAQSNASDESVSNYIVSLNLQSSGILHVTEDITYNFGTNQRHGIFRIVPLYPDDWPELSINNVNVANPASNAIYPFTTNESSGDLQIRVGDPNVLITGTREYQIDYDVVNAVRSFSDHDELYWNAIGTEWPVPIEQASAVITLPSSIPNTSTSTYCYTGAANSQSQNCTVANNASGTITATVSNPLPANDGLTISVSVPKGYISNTVQKTVISGISGFLSGGALPFIFFCFIFVSVFLFGIIKAIRSKTKRTAVPKELKNTPIAPYYTPPDGLSPAMIGYAENRVFDASDFTSIILDLAVRGFLKIQYLPKEGFLGREDYELTALKPYDSTLPPEYEPAYNLFFTGGTSTARLSSVDKYLGIGMFKKASKLVETEFDQAGYAIKPRTGIFGWLLLVFFCGAGIGLFINPFIFAACFALFFAGIFIAGWKSRQKFTPKGIELMQKVLGYKMFLTFTAEDRLKLMDAPKLSPEDFEQTLPYAIALGIEKQWAQQFQSLTLPPPRWIDDPRYRNGFNAGVFVTSFGSFTSAMRSSVTPSGSGAGGGGSVGGGGGGGGGGSW